MWWLQVILNPEDKRIIVFNKGISMGLKTETPTGGQKPTSIDETKLTWKKVQKKETKNISSDKINKIIPNFIKFITCKEWLPWKVLSRITSRHHWKTINNSNKNLIKPIHESSLFLNINKYLIIINKTLNEPNKGQGLLSTKWYVWK